MARNTARWILANRIDRVSPTTRARWKIPNYVFVEFLLANDCARFQALLRGHYFLRFLDPNEVSDARIFGVIPVHDFVIDNLCPKPTDCNRHSKDNNDSLYPITLHGRSHSQTL